MLLKLVIYGQQPLAVACDGKCNKAWGMNNRPKNQLSEKNVDDYEWLSDNELGEAPIDPGTMEGADRKPVNMSERMNKWCVRECERCKKCEIVDIG